MKRLMVLLALVSLSQSFFAAYLSNVPQILTQPDGTVLNCYATGDEFYHWLHDQNAYTIIKDSKTGFFVYADLFMDSLVPTPYIPGKDDPAKAGLKPGIRISSSKIKSLRQSKYQIPKLKGFSGTNNTGTLNNIVIFIRFSDQSEFTTPLSSYESNFNGTNQVSVYEYYKEVSNNQLSINTDFFPSGGSTVVSYQDSESRSYYQPYDATTNPTGYDGDNDSRIREHTLLKNAVEYVSSQIEATGNDFDMDNDGYIDNITFIIQGATDGWSDLLWPHMWALYSFDVRVNGLQVYYYNFQLSNSFGVSVLCHELFHTLGAPDLYRYDNDDITPVGPWDLMARNLNPPQHMSAYMKTTYGGWFNSIPEITTDGTYTLAPLDTDPFAAYVISSPNSSEYFVVEYRKNQGRFESSLPGSGLIIYRIDPALEGNADGPPDEIYVYRPGGTTSQDGNVYSAYFSSGSGRTEINDATDPSSFLSNGSAGGLNISNIGSSGATISFDVSFETVGFNSPKNLQASSGLDFIDLDWELPNAGDPTLAGFKVQKFGTLIQTINDPAATSYRDNNLSPGLYSYTISAFYTNPIGESDPSNSASAEILELKPDLTILGLSVSPENTDAGTTINTSLEVKNIGGLIAQASTMDFYISTDNQLDDQDNQLYSTGVNSLDPQEFQSFDIDLELPDDLETGNYFIILMVDQDELIDELNEDNNISFRIIGVRATFADLQLNRVESEPSEVVPAELINISANWTNTGNRIAGANDLIVALSEDQYYDGSDIALQTFFAPALPPGETYFFTDQYQIPGTLEPGNYFLVFLIDGNEIVPESNEANNEDYALIEVLAEEDISLSDLRIDAADIKDGEDREISFQIKNYGLKTIDRLDLQIILANENNFTDSDLTLLTVPVLNILPGQSQAISADISIPAGTIEKTYYIHVYCDPVQVPDDSNIDNNHIFRQVNVINYYDLEISVALDQTEYKPGEQSQISLTLKNIETKPTTYSVLKALISKDNIADLDDQEIGDFEISSVAGNSQTDYLIDFEIGHETMPGLYYIIAIADATNQLSEVSEQNNLDYKSFKVLDTSSDRSINNSDQWLIYPNPADSWINLSYFGTELADPEINIFDYTGQLVYKQSLTLEQIENQKVNISQLSTGIYFLQIKQLDRSWIKTISVIR